MPLETLCGEPRPSNTATTSSSDWGSRRFELSREAGFLLAAKLYEVGKLTSGQAARLCGQQRVEFLLSLPRAGVPVSNLREEDADAEVAFARHA